MNGAGNRLRSANTYLYSYTLSSSIAQEVCSLIIGASTDASTVVEARSRVALVKVDACGFLVSVVNSVCGAVALCHVCNRFTHTDVSVHIEMSVFVAFSS